MTLSESNPSNHPLTPDEYADRFVDSFPDEFWEWLDSDEEPDE